MNRRRAWLAGVASLAGLAALSGALWRTHRSPGTGTGDSVDIWPMRFQTPQGGQLEMAGLRGKPLLVNFWATWCPPCVTELPLLDQFHRQQASTGWQVIGLAVDNEIPVREFLAKGPVGYPVGIAGMGGVELSRSMGNSAGALPFTIVFDRSGKVIQRKLGIVTSGDLSRWVDSTG
jgi:thiol-disulfide isomerase/thioredoxin